ncbi:MAG: J domain-containing protein [Myxococcota bacterium]
MTDRLDQLDYYTLLGLNPRATADEIRKAFHQFALKFHPDNHTSGDMSKLARATQIFRRGAEAYRVLLDPKSRKLYDDGLRRGELRLAPDAETARQSRASRPAQKVNRKAHPFFQKAKLAIKRSDWSGAKLNLKIALQHDPENMLLQSKLEEVEAAMAKGKGG